MRMSSGYPQLAVRARSVVVEHCASTFQPSDVNPELACTILVFGGVGGIHGAGHLCSYDGRGQVRGHHCSTAAQVAELFEYYFRVLSVLGMQPAAPRDHSHWFPQPEGPLDPCFTFRSDIRSPKNVCTSMSLVLHCWQQHTQSSKRSMSHAPKPGTRHEINGWPLRVSHCPLLTLPTTPVVTTLRTHAMAMNAKQ